MPLPGFRMKGGKRTTGVTAQSFFPFCGFFPFSPTPQDSPAEPPLCSSQGDQSRAPNSMASCFLLHVTEARESTSACSDPVFCDLEQVLYYP